LDQSDKGAILTMLSGAKIKIGSSKIGLRLVRNTYTHYLPERFSKHMVDSNLDPLKILNFPIVDKKVEIFFGAESDVAITKKLNGVSQFIHIHPFSKLDLKEVDSRSLAKIIDYCELELEVKVVITSGDLLREIHRVSKILSLCKSDPINLSANLTLNEVSALNKRALFFLGVDTALMHISAANSTPVLAFFGPTSPKVWGPWDNDLHFHNFLEYKEFQAVGIHRIYTDVSCYIARNKGYLERSMIKPDISLIRRQILVMLNENINT
jgi:heptosyltransferase-3